jgi:hypothetical protein
MLKAERDIKRKLRVLEHFKERVCLKTLRFAPFRPTGTRSKYPDITSRLTSSS